MKMEERDRLIREAGIAQGHSAAIQSFIDAHRRKGFSEADILAMIQEFFHLDTNDARALLEQK